MEQIIFMLDRLLNKSIARLRGKVKEDDPGTGCPFNPPFSLLTEQNLCSNIVQSRQAGFFAVILSSPRMGNAPRSGIIPVRGKSPNGESPRLLIRLSVPSCLCSLLSSLLTSLFSLIMFFTPRVIRVIRVKASIKYNVFHPSPDLSSLRPLPHPR